MQAAVLYLDLFKSYYTPKYKNVIFQTSETV